MRAPSTLRPRLLRFMRKFQALDTWWVFSVSWERAAPRCAHIVRGNRHWLPLAIIYTTGKGKKSKLFRQVSLVAWGFAIGLGWLRKAA